MSNPPKKRAASKGGRSTAAPISAERMAQEIVLGRHDDHLLDLNQAIVVRLTKADVAWRWRIRWDGFTVTEDDLTLAEAERLEEMLGISWADISPMKSAKQCRAILLVCLVEREGLTPAEADERTAAMTTSAVTDMIDRYQVSPAPFERGRRVTTSSCSAPGSAGPRT